jgi:outer membrane protein insertion porin family
MKHALAALILVALAVPAQAEPIRAIEVFENTKTRSETVILIAGVEKGDDIGVTDVGEIEARLVDSGLFKDVEVFTQPMSGGVKLIIIARDKHSWVIAPTVYNQPTNKGAGVGFGENNLFGENKKLLLYGQVATGDSFFIGAYVDPSIAGTRWKWQADVFLRRERVIEYTGPQELVGELDEVRKSKLNYLNTGLKFGFELFRSASLEARGRGAYVSYDDVELVETATIDQVDPDLMPGDPIPAPGAEGWDFSYEIILGLDRRANWYGISHGDQYRLTYERTIPGISDFEYWYSSFRFLRARKYFERHNLIVKGMVGYGDNLPFQQEYSSGGTDLRGYKNRQLRGDFKTAGNVEYSVPLFTIAGVALRALAFYDVSYTAFLDPGNPAAQRHYLPSHGELGLAPLKNSVGLGTRVYMRQIVLPLLGLDIGYGLERGELEIYFAVGLTDF